MLQDEHYSKEIVMSAKSLKNPQDLSSIISKILSSNNEEISTVALRSLPKIDEVDENDKELTKTL